MSGKKLLNYFLFVISYYLVKVFLRLWNSISDYYSLGMTISLMWSNRGSEQSPGNAHAPGDLARPSALEA